MKIFSLSQNSISASVTIFYFVTITNSPEGRGKNPRKAGALGRGLNMGISIFVTNQLFVTERARKGLFQEDIFYVAKL